MEKNVPCPSKKDRLKNEVVLQNLSPSHRKGFAKQVASMLKAEEDKKNPKKEGTRVLHFQEQKNKVEQINNLSRITQLFTDEKGPWVRAPDFVKQLFPKDQILENRLQLPEDFSKINNLIKQFPPRQPNRTKRNYCCDLIEQKYYICYNCFQQQNKQSKSYNKLTFVLCSRCFEPEQHVGHYYQLFQAGCSQKIFCLCGKDMFKSNRVYTCRNHVGGYDVSLEVNKDMQDIYDQLFGQILKSLFSIAFYVQKEISEFTSITKSQTKSYFNFISNIIILMKQHAIDYGNVIIKILFQYKFDFIATEYMREINAKQKRLNSLEDTQIIYYLLKCFSYEPNTLLLITKLIGRSEFGFRYYKLKKLVKNITIENYNFKDRLVTELHLQMRYVEMILEEEGHHSLQIQKYAIVWLKNPSNYTYAIEYVRQILLRKNSYKQQKIFYLQNMELLIQSFEKIKVGDFWRSVGPELLPHALSCYELVYVQNIIDQIRDEDQDGQMKEEIESIVRIWQKNKIMLRNIINRIIVSLCCGNITKIVDFFPIAQEIENRYDQKYASQFRLNQYLQHSEYVCENLQEFCQDFIKQLNLQGHRFNENIFKPSQLRQYRYQLKQSQITDQYFNIFTSLLLSLNTLQLGEMKKFPTRYEDYKSDSPIKTRVIINDLLKIVLFYRYLIPEFVVEEFLSQQQKIQLNAQKQEIVKNVLFYENILSPVQLRNLKKHANIINFNEIVSSTLSYNLQQKHFCYKNEQKYQNCIQLLKKQQNNFFISVPLLQDLDKRLINQTQRQILIKLCHSYQFAPRLRSQILGMIKKYNQKNLNAQKKQTYSFIFDNILAYINILCLLRRLYQQKNNWIEEQLQSLTNSFDKIFKLQLTQHQKQQINLLLRNAHHHMSQQKYQHLSQQNNHIQGVKKQQQNKPLVNKGENEQNNKIFLQSCVLCNKKEDQQNLFVYLMRANANSTVSSSFFSEINIMKTNLRICFHPIHINCYKNNSNCPLCNKFVNCIIPTKYEQKNKKLNRVTTSSMIAVLYNQYQMYDIENIFLLLFKHLVQSKAFLAQINVHIYQQNKQKRAQTDNFILNYLKDYYHKSNNYIRQQIQESINNLKVEAEKKQMKITAKIQQLFIFIIYQVIKTGQSVLEVDKVVELYLKMRTEQFMIVKIQIQELGVQIPKISDYQQPGQHNYDKKQKISKQYPVRLPNDASDLAVFYNKGCSICKSSHLYQLCLICGMVFCKTCQKSSKHENQHEEKTLQFIFSELKVKFNMNLSSENKKSLSIERDKQLCLYYDELKIPYKEVLNNAPLDSETRIRLNEVIYYGLSEMLLN